MPALGIGAFHMVQFRGDGIHDGSGWYEKGYRIRAVDTS
jgi:hypothetical protein